MTTTLKRSSWIDSIGYVNANGVGYLAVFTFEGRAILYRGIPSTLPGLIAAGRVYTKDHERLSHGAAYNRLVKGRYECETITDAAKVNELREMRGHMRQDAPQNKRLYYYQDIRSPERAGWFGGPEQLRKAFPCACGQILRVCCPEDVPAHHGYRKTGRGLANDYAERIPTMKDLVDKLTPPKRR